MHRLKRWVVLTHLYLGLALALLFAMWFATGIVLMYAPFPGFGADRAYRELPPLDCTACTPALATLLAALPERKPLTPIRVGMDEQQPVIRYATPTGQMRVLGADDLTPLPPLDLAGAARRAASAARVNPATAWTADVITRPDQWTVEKVLRDQLPLVRVDFGDAPGTRAYVSVFGREVVTHSTRRERALAWIGAIPHWLYPRLLRERVKAWVWTIVVLGALGTLMSLAGVAVGVWQARWRQRREGKARPFTPYRTAWMRWHHVTGLAFGLVTSTWIFSGMMSVTPFDWSPGDRPSAVERRAFAGGTLDARMNASYPTVPMRDVVRLLQTRMHGAIRELEPRIVRGELYWVGYDGSGHALAFNAALDRTMLSRASIPPLVRAMQPDVSIASVDWLEQHDGYYYTRTAGHERPLPVVRVTLHDRDGTTYYIDPSRLDVVMKQVTRSRWERWLYHGLHDFDFAVLTAHRPLWDVVVILLSLGGLTLAVTGVAGAWRVLAPGMGWPAGRRR